MERIQKGKRNHIGYAGELLVASLLSQYELNLSPVGGTAEVCDILVNSPKTHGLRRIEVKTRSNANSKIIKEEKKTIEKNKGWAVNNPIFTDKGLVYAFVDYKNRRMIPNSPVDVWFVPSTDLKKIFVSKYPNDEYPERIVVNYNRLNTKIRKKEYYYAFDKVFSGIKGRSIEKQDEPNKIDIPSYAIIKKFIYNTNRTKKNENMTDKMHRLRHKITDAREKWKKHGKWD